MTDRTGNGAEAPECDNEELLVRRVAGGDESAFDTLTRPFLGAWVRVARTFVGDFGEAEDVVFQVLEKLWERIRHEGRSFRDCRAYGLRMVQNEALSRLRGRSRAARHDAEAGEPSAAGGEDPLDAVLARETRQALDGVLESLPVEDQRIVELHVLGELAFAEVARRLSTAEVVRNEAWARKRYQRVRELLRKRAETIVSGVKHDGSESTD